MLFAVVAIVEPLWLKTRAPAHEEQTESPFSDSPKRKHIRACQRRSLAIIVEQHDQCKGLRIY